MAQPTKKELWQHSDLPTFPPIERVLLLTVFAFFANATASAGR